jgi:hypothetical protein
MHTFEFAELDIDELVIPVCRGLKKRCWKPDCGYGRDHWGITAAITLRGTLAFLASAVRGLYRFS